MPKPRPCSAFWSRRSTFGALLAPPSSHTDNAITAPRVRERRAERLRPIKARTTGAGVLEGFRFYDRQQEVAAGLDAAERNTGQEAEKQGQDAAAVPEPQISDSGGRPSGTNLEPDR
jgi:hypothetical protein